MLMEHIHVNVTMLTMQVNIVSTVAKTNVADMVLQLALILLHVIAIKMLMVIIRIMQVQFVITAAIRHVVDMEYRTMMDCVVAALATLVLHVIYHQIHYAMVVARLLVHLHAQTVNRIQHLVHPQDHDANTHAKADVMTEAIQKMTAHVSASTAVV